jgi:hypothetical protein
MGVKRGEKRKEKKEGGRNGQKMDKKWLQSTMCKFI